MSEKAETATSRNGAAGLTPQTAVHRTGHKRHPTGAPPPLPHPFAITTAAWLILALAVLASAFLVSLHCRRSGSITGSVPGCFASWLESGRPG